MSHFAWITLAGIGILLLTPISGVNLDMIGVVFALLAGTGWGLLVVLSAKVSSRTGGSNGLTIAMIIAAIAMVPSFSAAVPTLASNPAILLAGIGVALLSITIPLSFEFETLKKLPPRTYGVLVSLEPGVAAMVGALLLGECLGIQGLIAVV